MRTLLTKTRNGKQKTCLKLSSSTSSYMPLKVIICLNMTPCLGIPWSISKESKVACLMRLQSQKLKWLTWKELLLQKCFSICSSSNLSNSIQEVNLSLTMAIASDECLMWSTWLQWSSIWTITAFCSTNMQEKPWESSSSRPSIERAFKSSCQ